jgi:4,5-DOPA dioxygenase extradiol
MKSLPVVFISHGSPMALIDDDEYTRSLRTLGQAIPTPAAIVVVSAHWQERSPIRVTSAAQPELIYDFGGFPRELYQLGYPSPGAPELATEIVALLEAGGFPARPDPERGLDHGTWSPLRHAYPSATVPVVQVSLPRRADPAALLRVGQALAPLRDRNVLLIGSGGIVHNLGRVIFDQKDAPLAPWALEFDGWVRDRVAARQLDQLVDYRALAPHASLAVPSTEHFDPLFVVLGASTSRDRMSTVHEGIQYGSLSMQTFLLASGSNAFNSQPGPG